MFLKKTKKSIARIRINVEREGTKKMFAHTLENFLEMSSSRKIFIASYRITCSLSFWFKISFPSINLLIIVGFPCSREEIVLEKGI